MTRVRHDNDSQVHPKISIATTQALPSGRPLLIDTSVMDSTSSHTHVITTIHHLYRRADDLLPACGIIPGPDSLAPEAEWHTGHPEPTELLRVAEDGQWCCSLCLKIADPEPAP